MTAAGHFTSSHVTHDSFHNCVTLTFDLLTYRTMHAPITHKVLFQTSGKKIQKADPDSPEK